jgi:acetylornithine/succinyldiaminopimelate/putrescine aminotransferase
MTSAVATSSRTKRPRRATLGRTEPPVDFEVVRTEGARLYDARGRDYVDFRSSWCVGSFGWGDPDLRASLADYEGPDYVDPQLRSRLWDELCELLVALAPRGLTTCFRATGGTEAVELALAAALLHTGRRGFLTIEGCYHGDSLATSMLADDEFGLDLDVERLDPPLDDRAAERAEEILEKRRTAALVMEPVAISAGVHVPTPGFMRRVCAACRRTETLFVADEVATGFGRTGALFACDLYRLRPDVLCVAKAVTGGYAPLGATLVSAGVAKSLADHPTYYSTFGWHPRSCAAAVANLRRLQASRPRLEREVRTASEWFRRRLAALPFEGRPEVRGAGLVLAVEIDDEDYLEQLTDAAVEAGVLVAQTEGAFTLFPPLTIDRATAEVGMARLERAVASVRR